MLKEFFKELRVRVKKEKEERRAQEEVRDSVVDDVILPDKTAQ